MVNWLLWLFAGAVAVGFIVRLAVDWNERRKLVIVQRQLLEVQENIIDRNNKLPVMQKQMIAALKADQDPQAAA